MLQAIFTFLFIISSISPYAGEMVHYVNDYSEMEEIAMENEAFRNIQVKRENSSYVVTGEARSRRGNFFYVVEDGHNEFIHEQKVPLKLSYPEWSTIKIDFNIPKEALPNSGMMILYLYERNEDGSMVNKLPVMVEEIQADN